MVRHAVDVRPEGLGMVRCERELNLCVQAHQSGLLNHLAHTFAVANGDAAIEIHAIPGDTVDDVALDTGTTEHAATVGLLDLSGMAVLNADDDGLKLRENSQ